MEYNETNYTELVKLIGSVKLDKHLDKHWRKKRYELQVHTNGYVYDAIVYNYPKEEVENTQFLINNYEPITKGSVWRGIDGFSKVLTNTSIEISGASRSVQFLNDNNIVNNYLQNIINKTSASDPNTYISYVKRDNILTSYFIETPEIIRLESDYIIYIDLENSEYTLEDDYNDYYDRECKGTKKGIKFVKSVQKKFTKKRIIYVSNSQYIEIEYKNGKSDADIILNENIVLEKPYYLSGVDVLNGIGNSPIHSFIPFGNRALLQYRAFIGIENIYGYPRLTEKEMQCNECYGTTFQSCDITDENPLGKKSCETCNGTGLKSIQSVHNVYKAKVNEDGNTDMESVRFHTLPTDMIDRSEKSWLKSIELGEDAIYVQKKIQTGNVESEGSKQITLEAMYNWLDRMATYIYPTMGKVFNGILNANGFSEIKVAKPTSYSILDEMDAFKMFSEIISSENPNFLKATQIESLLKRFVSSDNSIHKIVSVLKKVDKFLFYSNAELGNLSDRGVINDEDWRVHAMAYPTLMQLIEENPDLIYEDANIIKKNILASL